MSDEQATGPNTHLQLNVEADRLHLIVTPVELGTVVDALRSVGNSELAERFEAVLRDSGYGSDRERHV